MPFESQYFEDGAEIRYTGVVSGVEILRAKQEFFSYNFRHTAKWVLCDFSGVEEFRFDKHDIERIINQDLRAAAGNPSLAECVVATKPYEYGMARMWEMQVDRHGRNTIVARSRNEGEEWLRRQGLRP